MPAPPTEIAREIAAALDGAAVGTLILDGGPGTGKTAVLLEVADRLSGRGFRIGRASCQELSLRSPFGAVCDALGLARPPRITPGLPESLLAAADDWCAGGRVALVVDDAHHADADSLGLLWRLHAMTRDIPLHLVLSRRPAPARDLLAALARSPRTRRLTLPAADPQPAVGVNPAQLSREARGVADVLAVWAGPMPVAVLTDLRETSLLRMAEAISELTDLGLVVWADAEHLRFAREADREACYERIDPGVRRLMHSACRQQLEAAGGPAELLAHHLERSVARQQPDTTGTASEPDIAASLRGGPRPSPMRPEWPPSCSARPPC